MRSRAGVGRCRSWSSPSRKSSTVGGTGASWSCLWITIFTDFFLAQRLASTEVVWKRKLFLAMSFTISLSLLGFFKYWNFFVDTAVFAHLPGAGAAHIPSLILPVGISFYTFQSLSYVFDVYRRVHEPVHNLVSYAAFVSYFPQLVAGPIQRLGHLLPPQILPAPRDDRTGVLGAGDLFLRTLYQGAGRRRRR